MKKNARTLAYFSLQIVVLVGSERCKTISAVHVRYCWCSSGQLGIAICDDWQENGFSSVIEDLVYYFVATNARLLEKSLTKIALLFGCETSIEQVRS